MTHPLIQSLICASSASSHVRAPRLASPSLQAILLPLLPPPPVPYRGTAEVDEDEGGHELEALTKPSPATEGGRSAVAAGTLAGMS